MSVCAYCASFLKFDDELRLALLTEEEIAALPDDARNLIRRAREFLKGRERP